MSVAFESTHASEQVARRLIRDMNQRKLEAMDHMIEATVPLATAIQASGKLRRGMLEPIVRKVHDNLLAMPTIVHCDLEGSRSALSSNERFVLRGMFVGGYHDEELVLMGFTMEADRKHLRITAKDSGLRVIRHVLTRFMIYPGHRGTGVRHATHHNVDKCASTR